MSEPNGRKEFTKGVFFGILLSMVFVMAAFLATHGTIDFFDRGTEEEDSGAQVLTSRSVAKKLKEIEEKIESDYLNEVDGELLADYLFKGVAVGLDDPYAGYYTAEEMEDISISNEGEYYGIGITMMRDTQTGGLYVMNVYEESPSWKAGIEVGDELLRVEGETVTGMDLSSVAAMIRGSQDAVSLVVGRDGQELVMEVKPSSVEFPTVSCRMLENQIGYIKIVEFSNITVQQFQKALDELEEQGMEKLIVDLRDNPGGMLPSVCEILDKILPEGLIVYSEDKNGNREEYLSDEEHRFEKPLAVLVNGSSASASEIFAGAVQDYGLGTVIGTQTYGKGLVQHTYLLSDGSALKFTAEKYYTPKGRDINGTGITPDIKVEQPENSDSDEDVQLRKAIEFLNDR